MSEVIARLRKILATNGELTLDHAQATALLYLLESLSVGADAQFDIADLMGALGEQREGA